MTIRNYDPVQAQIGAAHVAPDSPSRALHNRDPITTGEFLPHCASVSSVFRNSLLACHVSAPPARRFSAARATNPSRHDSEIMPFQKALAYWLRALAMFGLQCASEVCCSCNRRAATDKHCTAELKPYQGVLNTAVQRSTTRQATVGKRFGKQSRNSQKDNWQDLLTP